MQRHLGAIIVLVLWILAGLPAPVWSQKTPDQEPAGAVGSGDDLTRTMQQLIEVLKEHSSLLRLQLERQETELALRRLELMARKLAPLEQQLADVRSRKLNTEEELTYLQAEVDRLENLTGELDDTAGDAEEGYRQALEQLNAHLRLLGDQIWSLEQRAIELEGELDEKRQAVEALEAFVDERIGR